MESLTDEEISKINALDLINYISITWDEINPEIIKNFLNKAYFGNVLYENVLNSDEPWEFEEAFPDYTISIGNQLIMSEK
ncbi:Hypothetical protein CINCED_3A012807 [Cinara cedri]|uniref:Uncharacterized protein n=1 Tax=Cinara cedri TaxID=506608 RepID=A0A5E4N9B3_9HEMI|nr:Hypothetical protein CINCED_3A012807 [Cinara cedri]